MVNTLLTAIADKIRKLLGLSDSMGLEAMSSNLTEVDDEVDSQAELISQITAALADKAAGSGGGGSIETYTGSLRHPMLPLLGNTVIYTDKNLNIQSIISPSSPFEFEVVKNSIIYISGGICDPESGCERLGGGQSQYAYKITENNFSIIAAM